MYGNTNDETIVFALKYSKEKETCKSIFLADVNKLINRYQRPCKSQFLDSGLKHLLILNE